MNRKSLLFLIASLPAALARLWGFGLEVAVGSWLPLIGVSLVVSWLWAKAFARGRDRPLDSGWIVAAWLFSLLVPVTMPLGFAALGLSFGLVFGCHVFGGTGRYLANPALLGVVFLAISYPPPAEVITSTEAQFALGIASLFGAAFLIATRAAAASLVAAAIAVLIVASLADGAVWHSHLTAGSFAFVLAFVATDPTIRPTTTAGCWTFGALFGALTFVLRTFDPAAPEGSLSALLLAALCVPLLDHIANAGRARALGKQEAGDA